MTQFGGQNFPTPNTTAGAGGRGLWGRRRLWRLELAVVLGFALTVAMSGFASFLEDCRSLQGEVLRFHVLANSDSREDQRLKLQVRDRLLEESAVLFSAAGTREEAEQAAARALPQLERAAAQVIAQEGYRYPVKATLVNMYFDTREYESFTMPAGWYDAVRVVIGSGEGKNWWCVMFPQLCVPAALEETGQTAQPNGQPQAAGGGKGLFSQSQLALLESSPRYEPRFAAVEVYERVKGWFTGRESREILLDKPQAESYNQTK